MKNKVMLVGVMNNEPYCSEMPDGSEQGAFEIRVDENVFDCYADGSIGQEIPRRIGKGEMLLVEGHLKASEWRDGDTLRRATFIEVESVTYFPACPSVFEIPEETNDYVE